MSKRKQTLTYTGSRFLRFTLNGETVVLAPNSKHALPENAYIAALKAKGYLIKQR